jgi:DNA polymerase III subunit alpha
MNGVCFLYSLTHMVRDFRNMSSRPFVHLHCHSHYSLLDGAASIGKLVQRTVERGMNALALTDHGNLHGALEFYRKCKDKGINPIIGYEAYIAPGSRLVKSGGAGKESSYHLTLLAKNATGFRNLIKLASAASLEGFHYKPRIDKELLAAYQEGLICLSGCVSSEFSRAVLRGGNGADDQIAEAIRIAQWFHGTFGDRYFIEIMNNDVEIQREQLKGAVEVANRIGLPLVATSDCHYCDREDAAVQDVMLCINTGSFRTDTQRLKMENHEFFLRSPEEMYSKFPGLEDACLRSQEIADTVDIQLELGKRFFPIFKLPPEVNPDDRLRELCYQGLVERYADNPEMCSGGVLSQVVIDRIERELGVIKKLGFANYFLICWDFVDQARQRDIPATARGSGVGAIVCFALYLSHVCPIKYGLLFERFLDENRLEAPDIDIDFCKERRGEIIRYVKDKYGEESVAQIGTFGTMKARAAIKDVGRALGIPLARVNQVTAMVPEDLNITLAKAIQKSEDLRKVYEGDPEIGELLDFAKQLEGMARNIGTHAAAVVIGDGPLTNYVPLGRVTGKSDIITQWSMKDVEQAGLLKMDFLGLRTLTILSNTVNLIQQTTGQRIDVLKFPLDDQASFRLLQSGETKGVFQLESGGIRDLLQKMKPDHFLDIVATNALYRPGPLEGGMVQQYIDVKHGRKAAEYKHPVLQTILQETNGVMVYQEQVMQILNQLGQIPLAAAYTCIKAISKKDESLIAKNYQQFMQGAVAQGLNKKDAQDMWDMILKFAGYGFNKSHSTAYALVAYQTAYLKAHYPVEFMAALLTGDIPGRNFTSKDSLVEHMEDCARMNVAVVHPCINRSDVEFTVTAGKIHFALSAIKGCGAGAAEALATERKTNGPFKNLFDVCQRVEVSRCGRSSLESLIKAGAMDCFGARRSQLFAVLDKALQVGAARHKDKLSGQRSLFDEGENVIDEEETTATVGLPDVPEMDERQKLAAEKEVLGFYLSSHPLAAFEDQLTRYCSHKTTTIGRLKDRDRVSMGGMLSSIKVSHVKNPKDSNSPTKYVMFDLEDVEGAIRCILWPQEYAKFSQFIVPDAIVVMQGRLDFRGGDEANLIVDKVVPINQLSESMAQGIRIRIDERELGVEKLRIAHEVLRGYPGDRMLKIQLALQNGTMVDLDSKRRIEVNEELCRRLRDVLGETNVEALIDEKSLSTKADPAPKWRRS